MKCAEDKQGSSFAAHTHTHTHRPCRPVTAAGAGAATRGLSQTPIYRWGVSPQPDVACSGQLSFNINIYELIEFNNFYVVP